MEKELIHKLIIWLRRKHPGTIVNMRDFLSYIMKLTGTAPMNSRLLIRVIRKDGAIENRGIVSTHAITSGFVELLVDTLQSPIAAFSTFRYHDSGTGTTAENENDTALETPCGEAKDTGTQAEGDSANVYRSMVIHTYAGNFEITEHALLNSNDVLADRSVFTAIGVAPGDRIEFTYELECISGG